MPQTLARPTHKNAIAVKCLVVKQEDNFFRLLKFEEGRDGSLYTHRLWIPGGKISCHSNYGAGIGPFRVHQYGVDGKLIADSIDKSRTKFIADYIGPFQKYHLSSFPKNTKVDAVESDDVVLNITGRLSSKPDIVLFSEKRSDLLDGEFDNAIIVKVQLKTFGIIAGCFNLK